MLNLNFEYSGNIKQMLKLYHISEEKTEAGVDEAGRGSFWGPMMAGAVIWPSKLVWTKGHFDIYPHIKDSKKISPKKRVKLAEEIKKLATSWAVGTVMASEIDEHGITWANREAFRRALCGLAIKPDNIIIDGALNLKSVDDCQFQYTVIDGDAIYLHIAAASIIAKTEHDTWIENYCKSDIDCAEKYNLISCKGYGTAKHIEGLHIYGYHKYHRCSFINKHTTVPLLYSSKPTLKFQQNQSLSKCLINLNGAKCVGDDQHSGV